LRHLERTRALVHVLEVSLEPGRTPLRDYLALRRELALYDPELARRAEIVALNKMDLPATRKRWAALQRLFARRGIELHGISAATGEGLGQVLEAAFTALAAAKQERTPVTKKI
jgi:GTP-binding protein